MSKPGISISLGKPKTALNGSKPTLATASRKPATNGFSIPSAKRTRLTNDSDTEDEGAPAHEAVTGFDVSSGGAISSRPVQEKEELVIKNAGNADWRRRGRGKNILPDEVKAQREEPNGAGGAVSEKQEVSTESGLQLAAKSEAEEPKSANGRGLPSTSASVMEPSKPLTDDELALQALLRDGKGDRVSTRVIEQQAQDDRLSYNEIDDYRADVAARPDSCTLEEYAAMPVEEFGMALLRGMGSKRKARGEVISFGTGDPPKTRESRAGYLGLGAKGVPRGAEVEIGAWGKSAMRKNKNGEGLYTPVVLKDKRTGEVLTEEELEARKKETKNGKGEEDWRDRRDRNLHNKERDDRQALMNGTSQKTTSRRSRSRSKDRNKTYRDRDRDATSRDHSDRDGRERHFDRDQPRIGWKEGERYESGSSHKKRYEDRIERQGRDRDRDRDPERYRDRHRAHHREDERRRRDR